MDLNDLEFIADPYPTFARRRAEAPVQWDPDLGMFLAFGHAAANAVLRDRSLGRIWRDRVGDFDGFNLIHRNALLEMEPPEHPRVRRLVAAAFGRGHVERLRPRIATLAAGLADDLHDAGSEGSAVDLISIYAEPLPVAVIAELLGIPDSDLHLLRPWSNAIVKMYEYDRTPETERAAEVASTEFADYLREIAAFRRRTPGEDLITTLVQIRDADGDRLTEDELVSTGILLLNAGHEATVNVTGNGLNALLEHPAQLQATRDGLENDAAVADAVEELLRYDGPLQLFERTATAQTSVAGVQVAPGQKIAALLGSANRDPAVFERAEDMDVRRTPNPHISFGGGIHFCLGAPLARVELQSSLRTLLARFPDLQRAGEAIRRPEFVIRGLSSLPVAL